MAVGIKGEGIGDSPNAIPAFATAARSATLVPMATQEINTTQPGRIAQDGNDDSKAVPASFDIRNSAFGICPVPPKGNANFAWVQHFIHHLAPHGMAGLNAVRKDLANGSMSSNQPGEGDIRRALIEADLVDCMVALPGQLFYSTQIPVCLWFLAKNKAADAKRGFRDRRKQTLFIDARKLGTLIDRVHRELTDTDLEKITSTYHAWRGDKGAGKYEDVAGFCKSATTAEIAAHGHVLTPGRYVGAEEVADDGDPFEEKMLRLVAELHAQFAKSANFHDKLPTPCIVIATQRLAA